jgi:hypothetical protein
MAEVYEIRVRGHLSKKFDEFFNGMTINRETDGTSIIMGELADQTALHSVLFKIRNMNIGLISVNKIESEEG